MDAKLKNVWEKIKGFFSNMNKKVRIFLGVALAVLLAAVAAFVIWSNNQPYRVLFTGLSDSEASSIMSFLEENGITDYQIKGDSIWVRSEQENQLKAKLLMSGYPKSGYLYDSYFNNVTGMSTNSERNTAFLIALQERLEAIIRYFDDVKEAKVNISPGKDQTYVLDDKSKVNASAAVFVTLRGSTKLSNQQAAAIRTMVSRSVQGLSIEDVSITDNLGNRYSSDGSGVSSLGDGSELKLRLEEETNNKVRTNVMQALADVYGADNVRVAVNSVVDVSRRVIESTEYSQPGGANTGAGLIGSETWFYQVTRGEDPAAGGAVGTTTNSEIPEYVEGQLQVDGNENYAGSSGSKDYDTNKTTQQTEVVAGTVTDISVAVTINEKSPNAGSINQDALLRHVAMASGIGSDDPASRIHIIMAPFYSEDPTVPVLPGVPEIPQWALYAAGGGLLVFLLLLLLIMRIRKNRKKKKQAKLQAALMPEELGHMPAASIEMGADIMEVNTEKSMELRKVVRQFSQNNPEIAAQMIKGWLKGDEDNG